jgi:hypothetical protein
MDRIKVFSGNSDYITDLEKDFSKWRDLKGDSVEIISLHQSVVPYYQKTRRTDKRKDEDISIIDSDNLYLTVLYKYKLEDQ